MISHDITKKIDLKSYLPTYIRDEELASLVDVFESVLNEMYTVSAEYEYDNQVTPVAMEEVKNSVNKSPVMYKYGYVQPDGVDRTEAPDEMKWDYNSSYPSEAELAPVYPWVPADETNPGRYLNSTPPQHILTPQPYPNPDFDTGTGIPHPFDSTSPANVNHQPYTSTGGIYNHSGLYDSTMMHDEAVIPQFTNYFKSGYKKLDTITTISVFEKIHRLLDLKDPKLIDMEYLQYFADHMGWNLSIGLDTFAAESVYSKKFGSIFTQAEINEMIENQVRSFIINLPYWYRIKTTESALQVILFSFGLVADVVKWYTEDYSTNSNNWDSADTFFNTATYRTAINNRSEVSENFDKIPDDWYPTPHFTVRYDINDSFTLYTGLFKDQALFAKLVETIMAIKPITTVFNGITARLLTKKENITTIHSIASSFYTSRTTTGYKNNGVWTEVSATNATINLV